jgi:ABC-type sugar transport system ATPase subunit
VHGHIGTEKVSLTVRLPDVHRVEKHATIRLSIAQEKLHLFDPETKKRLD